MKPGRFEKSARFVLYLFINEQSGIMVLKISEELNLNVSDESLVDKYISVFLVND